VLLVSTYESGVVQRFVSQPLVVFDGIDLSLKVSWSRTTINVVLGFRRLEPLQTTNQPIFV